MIPILYESSETAFTSNGLGRLRDCISCTVTEERNGIYECDFEYPVDGAHFDEIMPGRIIAVTHDESGDIEPFDIVSSSKPISGAVTFHAVHVSYRLNGIVARAKNINSLNAAMQAIVETAQPSDSMTQFTFTTDFASSGFMAAFDGVPRSVRQLLGGIEGSVLDTYGGEFEFNNFDVILHSSRGTKRDFTIRYGVNLLDYNEETDFSGVYSSCIPYWHGQNSSGQEVTVVGSQVSLTPEAYNGRDVCVPLDLYEKFEDKPTAAQVESMALSVMQSRQVNLPSQTIKVDFVRLQDMPEFEQFANLLECNLCDTIGVVFPRYGMRGDYKIVKTVYDVLKDRYEDMELGALQTSLADALGITTSPTNDRINENFFVDADGNVTANGTINAANILKNGKNYIAYQTFTFSDVAFSSGTRGTRGYQGSQSVTLDGYTPIGVSVTDVGGSSSNYIPVAFISGSTVYLNAYRCITNSMSAQTCKVRVIYRKD